MSAVDRIATHMRRWATALRWRLHGVSSTDDRYPANLLIRLTG